MRVNNRRAPSWTLRVAVGEALWRWKMSQPSRVHTTNSSSVKLRPFIAICFSGGRLPGCSVCGGGQYSVEDKGKEGKEGTGPGTRR